MSPVITRPQPASARLRPQPLLLAGLAVAAVLAVAALVFSALGGPGFVDRLTVSNPTGAAIDVEVGKPGSAKSLPLGTVRPEEDRAFQHVVDQGDRWELRFAQAGEQVRELTLTRDDLEAREWKVEVPRA